VQNYNDQLARYLKEKNKSNVEIEDFIDRNPQTISWSSSLIAHFKKGDSANFEKSEIEKGIYRPFTKQFMYKGEKFIHRRGQNEDFFPDSIHVNKVICVSGIGSNKGFSTLITDHIPSLDTLEKTQCFPLYYYEPKKKVARTLFDSKTESSHIRRDGISDFKG
ncbi:MAG: hypothetical protein KDA70_18965, partial [Planctomycetaceae bacterium]|nr:hypothetical protein [Planctomycetaceae bacterium]